MFCMQCGAQLPDQAKFCFQCGAKVGEGSDAEKPASRPSFEDYLPPPPTNSAMPKRPEKNSEGSVVARLFASLDPVVCHSEYYFMSNGNPMLSGYSMAVNKNYVLQHISHFPDDEFLLSDDDGEDLIELDVRPKLRKAEYKNLMGFNTHGVWFLVCSQINERFLNERFICVDVVKGRTYEYPIEHQNGKISDVYVYADELYYINDTGDGKQFLHRLTPESSTELFSAQTKNESLFRLSANDKYVAWGYASSREGKERWYWYFFDRATEQRTQISAPRQAERTSQPLIDLLAVDLAKNTLYTGLSEEEAARFEGSVNSIATRRIEDPVEFRILSYKTDRQPAIWHLERKRTDFYFDGAVYYAVADNTELDRFDRFGSKFILGHAGGRNGACRNFLVTDKYLFVNYDAHDMVRLPKAFNECTEPSEENPEAFFIFDQGEDFRM